MVLKVSERSRKSTMSDTKPTPKDVVLEIVRQQPDDSSYEELMRELAFGQMIQRGLADIEAGRVISHDQLKQEVQAWRK
jgi:predicted transcriptional regulator